MADESPENVDLRFLAAQNARILRELGEIREQTSLIPHMRKDIAELQVGQAALSSDLKIVKEDVAALKEDVAALKEDVAALKEDVAVLKEDVADLKKDVADLKETSAIIESRLVRIEKQHGYVKA
jgi:chromosome segregation ATPase